MADQESLKWRLALASALKEWLGRSTYDSPTAFARDNGIEESTLRRILRAENVPGAAICAKICLATNLGEADPTKIPGQTIKSPRGPKGVHKRSWTDEEYRNWLKKQSKPKQTVLVTLPSSGPIHGATEVGTVVRLFFNQMQALTEELRKTNERLGKHGTDKTVTELTDELLSHLTEAINGSPSDRDRFQKAYGEGLVTLLQAVDALTRTDRGERERASERVREMGEVQL